MKKSFLLVAFFAAFMSLSAANPPIYIAFQWHMHQPIYVPGETVVQTANSGKLSYNLYDVFYERTGPYTSWPADAVNKLISAGLSNAGAQVSFSGSLIENLNTLEANGKGFSNWKSSWNNMVSKKTAKGNQRLEMVAFGYHHPLMPLTDNADIRKQIQKHKAIFATNFPGMPYSKGIFPPENAFEPYIIPALVEEGLQWVMVDNLHFDRACQSHPWASGSNIMQQNKADQLNPNPGDWKSLNNLWAPIPISAAWGHRPHWVSYIDPSTATEYKMIAVPTSAYFGNEDGRGGFGALNYENTMSQLESYNTDPQHPILIVLHHDGDNYGGGSDSYYGNNFQEFTNWVKNNSSRFVCTTIQDYLDQFPPAANDIIHVESGSWSGAGGDPEFLKWNGNPGSYMGIADNYSPDRNSWSVITATSNIIKTAEQINSSSADVKTAWDYLTMGETSCYWYWDGSENGFWDSHPTRASNLATAKVMSIVTGGNDQTPPSIYHPQRFPYNPGETEWNTVKPSDFTVWSYVYDVSGLQSVKLKYRTVKEGVNLLTSTHNKTYAGGTDVNAWQEINMTKKTITSLTNPLPNYKADEYSAEIKDLKSVFVDYYVEATDNKGNVARSIICHVWVGDGEGGSNPNGNVTYSPSNPGKDDVITITCSNATATTLLHWGVNGFTLANSAYYPAGTVVAADGQAVQTPFVQKDGKWVVELGPFNNAAQSVAKIDFVIKYNDDNWDNNNGNDYHITITDGSQPDGNRFTIDYGVEGSAWAKAEFERDAHDATKFWVTISRPTNAQTMFWIGYSSDGSQPKWNESRNETAFITSIPGLSSCTTGTITIEVKTTNTGKNWNPVGYCGDYIITRVSEVAEDKFDLYREGNDWKLQMPVADAKYQVQLFNTVGVKLMDIANCKNVYTLQTSQLNSGLYIVRVINKDTGKLYVAKIKQ